MPAQAAGGAASNATVGAAALGIKAAFIGNVGDDELGGYYRTALQLQGCDPRLGVRAGTPTGRVLALVTFDAQRTFRTCLGAAATLDPAQFTADTFAGAQVVMLEGYSLFNHDLTRAVARATRAAGAQLALDFAAHEVVRANRAVLNELLDAGLIDLAFLNQDEAAAWSGGDPLAALPDIAPRVRLVAVKLGADGAVLRQGRDELRAPPVPAAQVVDTTGAGDAWAAGFLAGWIRKAPLDICADLAARAGSHAVQVIGAQLPRPVWQHLKGRLDAWS
jgi:sugar/nucleoside kinase (ribokinase family)